MEVEILKKEIDLDRLDITKYLKKTPTRQLDGQKNQPWRLYREVKEGKLMTPQELYDLLIHNPKRASTNTRNRAHVAYLYLFSLRVGESIPYKYRGEYAKEGVKLELPSPKVKDIWPEVKPDKTQWLWARVRRQKAMKIRNDVVQKIKEQDRNLFLAIKAKSIYPRIEKVKVLYAGMDARFIDLIVDYIDEMRSKEVGTTAEQKLLERELFPVSRIYVDKMTKNLLGFPPHYLRALRASHLVVYKHFSASDLQKFVGWSTPNQALVYANSNEYLLEKRFQDAAKEEEEEYQSGVEYLNQSSSLV